MTDPDPVPEPNRRVEPNPRLMAMIYEDLQRIASWNLHGRTPDPSLNTTALAHEAYIRLAEEQRVDWSDRDQIRCFAAVTMKRILCDRWRRRQAIKRGGQMQRIEFQDGLASHATDPRQEALAEAIERLEEFAPRQARAVVLHAYAGYNQDEIARLAGVSVRTVRNDCRTAYAWLAAELSDLS